MVVAINRVSRANNPESNNGRILLHGTFIGFVKNNVDIQMMGRLQVYIPEIGGDPTNPNDWILVSYASQFAGSTNPMNVKKGDNTMAGTQSSYGWWGVPPDLNNMVLITFVNGDLARGFWFACVWQQNMNQMVPGIASATTNDPSYPNGAPTVEYNKVNETNPSTPTRAVFTPLADGISTQGLTGDAARGPSTASARRGGVSNTYGLLSPRGHQMYVDDDTDNEYIRIRTRSGAQIVVNETTGFVYINSKSGNAWLEVSDAGVDIYSKNSVSIRAEKDFNIRADNNIIFDAGGTIFMRAGSDLNIQTGGKIVAGASSDLILSTGGKSTLTVQGDYLVSVGGNQRSQSASDTTIDSGGGIIMQSSGDTSALAGGNIVHQGTMILDNPGNAASAPAVAANPAQVPMPEPAPDIQNGQSATVETITNRMPTHEPWRGHPNPLVPPPYTGPKTNVNGNGSAIPGAQTNLSNATSNSCATGVGTIPASNDVYNAIQTASATTGAPFGGMMAIADVESSFNAGAGSTLSSAKGIYQFTNSTWSSVVQQNGNQYNVSSDQILDPSSNALMGGAFYNTNVGILQNAGISNPSVGQVYMAHMLGSSGGPSFIQAYQNNPNAPLSSVLSQTQINNNPRWFSGQATVGDAYNNINGTMNTKASLYGAQAGLPAPCDRSGSASGTGSGTAGLPANANAAVSQYSGTSVGNGQCVSLVKAATNLGPTSTWQQGDAITPDNVASIPAGTPIATFQNGVYQNATNGNSHAAILLGPGTTADGQPGIQLLDQWVGHPASTRVIPFNAYNKTPANNGSSFSVINTSSA